MFMLLRMLTTLKTKDNFTFLSPVSDRQVSLFAQTENLAWVSVVGTQKVSLVLICSKVGFQMLKCCVVTVILYWMTVYLLVVNI